MCACSRPSTLHEIFWSASERVIVVRGERGLRSDVMFEVGLWYCNVVKDCGLQAIVVELVGHAPGLEVLVLAGWLACSHSRGIQFRLA